MVYYPTLEGEIARRGIKKIAIAKSLNICSKTLANKMHGRVPFTWPEVQKIKTQFFPDMKPEDLLTRAEPKRKEE